MEKIELIIVKYLNKEANVEELRILELWLNNEENVTLFNRYIKTEYLVSANMESFDINKAKNTIRERLRFNRRRRLFKISSAVAAAIVILGLITLPLFRSASKLPQNLPTIVKDINEPGNNTAILTLNDGAEIVLTDGETHDSDTYVSNGELITYNDDPVSEEITDYNTLTIPRGGHYAVSLSDGSKIWLNSDSKIKYPVHFSTNTARTIELVYGEIYLEVSPSSQNHGNKFIVKSQMQNIEVLGTKFNIKAYKEDTFTLTTLVEGSVAIATNTNRAVLSPNYQAKTAPSMTNIEITKANVTEAIAWKNGIFSFTNLPLKDIMQTLSRWYDTEVIFSTPSLETIKFTGVLGKDQSLQDILTIITNSNNIAYEIRDNMIIFK